MKKKLALLLIWVVLASSLMAHPLDVKVLTLSNGLAVWINEDHSQPKVFGAVVVRAGAKDFPGSGVAHYLEHLMFKGTQKIGTVDYVSERQWLDSITAQYDSLALTGDPRRRAVIQRHINALSVKAADYAIPNEFNRLITTYGGTRLNAYTSFDETVYHNYFSPQFLTQWCELYAERFIAPVFRLFQSELETVYEEKNMYADNLVTQTAEQAQRYALGGTPYAFPILGETDSLKNPRLSEMRRFFDRYYVASNMGLVLCGDVCADTIRPLLERTFGRIRASRQPSGASVSHPLLHGLPALRLKVPIPVVKARGYAYEAPREGERDYVPFQVMRAMLANGSTGLLDSLVNEGKLLLAMAGDYDFKDFSAFGWGFVPRVPFGTKRKAERLCRRQIERLQEGAFADEKLEAEKLALCRDWQLALETLDGRSTAMIKAFSHERPWQEFVNMPTYINMVTREDIMRVARRYFCKDSLRVTKVFGSYPKEHLSQPGYQPVRPKSVGRQSDFAKQMARDEAVPASVSPRLVDFEHDARKRRLRPLVSLYTVTNPENDVFELELRYRIGTRNDRRIAVLGDYLDDIGTTHWSKNELARRLRAVGASLEAKSTEGYVSLRLTGFDGRFRPALELLRSFLLHPKADKRRYKDGIVGGAKMERRVIFRNNASIARAVMQRVAYGDSSVYLSRPSVSDLKRLTGEELVCLFREVVQSAQLDVFYSGSLADDTVAAMVSSYLPIAKVSRAWGLVPHELQSAATSVVYLYDNPKARQTIVSTYQPLALGLDEDRACLSLWGEAFGGGMTSVLFQNIREFRSLAYSCHGRVVFNDEKLNPKGRCAYITSLGTQGDKVGEVIAVLDSLFGEEVDGASLYIARRSILNRINADNPTFRDVAQYIAAQQMRGYAGDPNRKFIDYLNKVDRVDVADFFQNHIKSKPRALIIVGNLKLLDLSALRRYGRLVMLHKRDLFR